MKRFIAAAVLTAFSAGMAMAAGPETIKLPAKMGTVTFPHKEHQERLKNCKLCHQAGPGKIKELGKEWAHKTCKGCHESKGKGPTRCTECHKK